MTCAVGQFVEDRAVILGSADKLLTEGEDDLVSGGEIESAVAFAVRQFYPLAFQVVVYDLLRSLNGGGAIRKMGFGGILSLDALALVDMEHVVIPQERELPCFGCPASRRSYAAAVQ